MKNTKKQIIESYSSMRDRNFTKQFNVGVTLYYNPQMGWMWRAVYKDEAISECAIEDTDSGRKLAYVEVGKALNAHEVERRLFIDKGYDDRFDTIDYHFSFNSKGVNEFTEEEVTCFNMDQVRGRANICDKE